MVEVEDETGVRRRRRRDTSGDSEAEATGATFGGGFKVPMNTLDLSVNAFSMLDENPVVFVFMVCCIAVYMTCLLWARKADQRDKVQVSILGLFFHTTGGSCDIIKHSKPIEGNLKRGPEVFLCRVGQQV